MHGSFNCWWKSDKCQFNTKPFAIMQCFICMGHWLCWGLKLHCVFFSTFKPAFWNNQNVSGTQRPQLACNCFIILVALPPFIGGFTTSRWDMTLTHQHLLHNCMKLACWLLSIASELAPCIHNSSRIREEVSKQQREKKREKPSNWLDRWVFVRGN